MTTKQKQVIGIGALLSFAILALGYLFLVKPTKSHIGDIKAQTASQESANAQLQTQIQQLQAQQQGLLAKQVELRGISQRIPSNSDIPGLLRDLTRIGKTSGVDIAGILPGTPTGGAVTPTATRPTPASTAAAGSSSTGKSSSAGTSSATSTSNAGTTSTAGTTSGSASAAGAAVATYETIPISLTVQGNYSQMVMFMDQLENLQRLYLVKGVTLTPIKEGNSAAAVTYAPDGTPQAAGDLAATVTGEVYETSADTTSITLPALDGASGSAAAPTN